MAKETPPEVVTLSDNNILTSTTRLHGLNKTVKHYLKKAREASKRAELDITSQNMYSLSSHTRQMIDAVDMMWRLMGDDKNVLTDRKAK